MVPDLPKVTQRLEAGGGGKIPLNYPKIEIQSHGRG